MNHMKPSNFPLQRKLPAIKCGPIRIRRLRRMATFFAGRSVRRILVRSFVVALALGAFGVKTPGEQLPPLPTAPNDDVQRDYSNAGNSTPGKGDGDIGGFGLGTPWELYVKSAMQVWSVPDPAGPGLGGTPPYFPYLVRQANCSL